MATVLVETNQFGGVTRIFKWRDVEMIFKWWKHWNLDFPFRPVRSPQWWQLVLQWKSCEALARGRGSVQLKSATPQRFSLTQSVIPNPQIKLSISSKLHGVAWLSYQDIYNTIEVVGGHFCLTSIQQHVLHGCFSGAASIPSSSLPVGSSSFVTT